MVDATIWAVVRINPRRVREGRIQPACNSWLESWDIFTTGTSCTLLKLTYKLLTINYRKYVMAYLSVEHCELIITTIVERLQKIRNQPQEFLECTEIAGLPVESCDHQPNSTNKHVRHQTRRDSHCSLIIVASSSSKSSSSVSLSSPAKRSWCWSASSTISRMSPKREMIFGMPQQSSAYLFFCFFEVCSFSRFLCSWK